MSTHFRNLPLSLLFAVILFLPHAASSQNTSREKMQQLDFLVGEWIGTSRGYQDGKVTREEPAYESISYDLDSSILVVQLNSQSLQLHTIIQYDEKEGTYYYYPFSKRGVRPAPASLVDGRLIVQPNEKLRFIFGPTPDGGFREYGEQLVDGKWVKYFQDDFRDTQ